MGGIGMAGNGTLHVVWSRSSATAGDFPSSYGAYQLPSDAANSISPKELLKAGTGVYTGERWGDYVGVAQDPLVPSAVWQGNEYSGSGAEWKTWISRLQPPARRTSRSPRCASSIRGPAGSGCRASSRQGRPDLAGHRRRRHPRRGGRGDRQRDGHRQESGGYVAVTPTATDSPPSSTINFPLGDNRANKLTVPLSRPARCRPPTSPRPARRPTHLRRDRLLPGRRHGATFTPLAPVRVLDTRRHRPRRHVPRQHARS